MTCTNGDTENNNSEGHNALTRSMWHSNTVRPIQTRALMHMKCSIISPWPVPELIGVQWVEPLPQAGYTVRLPSLLPNAAGLWEAYFPVEHGLMLLNLALGHHAFHSCNSGLVLLHPVGQWGWLVCYFSHCRVWISSVGNCVHSVLLSCN